MYIYVYIYIYIYINIYNCSEDNLKKYSPLWTRQIYFRNE